MRLEIGKQILLRQRFDRLIASDKKFQAFYLVVVDLFVKQIQADLSLLNKDRDSKSKAPLGQKPIFGLSYAAKWAVMPGKGTDKQLLIASAIALRLFPGDGITSARRRYQSEVLSPLRAALNVPEVAMSAQKWDQVAYTQVSHSSLPSVLLLEADDTGSVSIDEQERFNFRRSRPSRIREIPVEGIGWVSGFMCIPQGLADFPVKLPCLVLP
jgi:hypothetical protein